MVTLPGRKVTDKMIMTREFVAHAWHLGYKSKEQQQNLWNSHIEGTRGEECAIVHFYNGDINVKDRAGTKWYGQLRQDTTRWGYHTGNIEGCVKSTEDLPNQSVAFT